MLKLKRYLILLSAVAVMVAGAQAATYEIDPVHSQIGFRIRHIVSKLRGSFDTFSGTVDYDASKPETLKSSVVIKTASVNTANTKRDEDLRGPHFFDVQKFPEMTFRTTRVKSTGPNKLEVTGDFSLLGVTKPVTLQAESLGVANDPWGNVRAGFSAAGTLNRKDFGMVYNIAMDKGGVVIGDEVELLIEVEAVNSKK